MDTNYVQMLTLSLEYLSILLSNEVYLIPQNTDETILLHVFSS